MSKVEIFNLSNLGIDTSSFVKKIKEYYQHYEYDNYLYRQCLIKNAVNLGLVSLVDDKKIIEEFYLEGKGEFINLLSINNDIKKGVSRYRKRMIITLLVNRNGDIERQLGTGFGQENADVVSGAFDFRKYPRFFREAPSEALNEYILKITNHFSRKIFNTNSLINMIKVVIHYTIVNAHCGEVNTNSPEGIHQDGMDYIISALVVERENITGGVSKIYYPDYNNEIVNIELGEGMGIFQPDMNTELWHEVSDIYISDDRFPGYRSTVGFDFEVIK